MGEARSRLAALESGETIMQLRVEKETLAEELARFVERAENAERELREWVQLALSSAPEPRAVHVPIPVSTGGASPASPGGGCPVAWGAVAARACPGPDLCGRRVLYVGGRERQVAHFRLLVERQNGEFLHHDGGRNENAARLDTMIHAADAVLCPVDCVSHDACLRIKRICKHSAKRFVLLRSASLTCFQEGLHAITA